MSASGNTGLLTGDGLTSRFHADIPQQQDNKYTLLWSITNQSAFLGDVSVEKSEGPSTRFLIVFKTAPAFGALFMVNWFLPDA